MKHELYVFIEKHYILLVGLFSLFVYVTAAIGFWHNGQAILYNDARSRLLIARGIIDSLSPGLVQLGSVWLPIPQILFLPTIGVDFFMYSGLSGILVSVSCALIASIFLAKLLLELTKNILATSLALFSFIYNPSFMYMATTPMSEVPFVTFVIVSVYFLHQWLTRKNVLALPLAAMGTALATLTRYEAYILPVFAAVVIFLDSRKEKNTFAQSRGKVFLFATIAFAGIGMWFLYNLLIFGNAFHFVSGETNTFSRAAGELSGTFTRGNPIQTLRAFGDGVLLNVGEISLVVLLGAIVWALIKKNKSFLAIVFLFSAPAVFIVVSLYFGLADIFTYTTAGYLYNVRIGLLVLPVIPLAYAFLAKTKLMQLVLLAALTLQLGLLFAKPPITLLEAQNFYSVESRGKARLELVTWLQAHPMDKYVFISYVINQTVVFDARIPPSKVISEGTGGYWQRALAYPQNVAGRIIISPHAGDVIWIKSQTNPHYLDGYQDVYHDNYFIVYDLKP